MTRAARLRAIASGCLAVGLWLAVGASRERAWRQAASAANAARVAVVQVNVPPDLKRRAPADLVARYRRLTDDHLKDHRADLVVWSETAIARPVPEESLASSARLRVRGGFQVPVITGAVVEGSAQALTNSALLLAANGVACASCRYDKQILLPLAEYLPLEALWPALRRFMPLSGKFVPGRARGAIPIDAGHRAGVFICYEALYPDRVRALVRDRAHLLVQLANDAWFESTGAQGMHLALTALRAVENRRFLVRSTPTAVTGVIDAFGSVVARLPANAPGVLDAQVAWLDRTTLYTRLGDAPWWGLVLVGAATLAKSFRSLRASAGRARSPHRTAPGPAR